MFVPGKLFKPSLMIVGKVGAYLSEALFRRSTLHSLALSTNIRLGWKDLPEANTLAYYEHSSIKEVKGFITLVPGANVIKPFMAVFYECL